MRPTGILSSFLLAIFMDDLIRIESSPASFLHLPYREPTPLDQIAGGGVRAEPLLAAEPRRFSLPPDYISEEFAKI